MTFLEMDRRCMERHLPGLDQQLADVSLLDLEGVDGPGLSLFREAGGPALLIPAEHGGLGASLADAVRVQRAVASRSPSLAVATTMHHTSVAFLAHLSSADSDLRDGVLRKIASNNWLMSSGFAEGRSGQQVVAPTMAAVRVPGGLKVTGVKKPCSLTWSMDLMSASVSVEDPSSDRPRMAIVLVPAHSPGVDRKRFWKNWILAATESDAVILSDVEVPDDLVFYPTDSRTIEATYRGSTWFELLISASYVGAASGLAERVIRAGRGSNQDRVLLAADLDAATASLLYVALSEDNLEVVDAMSLGLSVRYAAERAVERATTAAFAVIGGMAFAGSAEIAYLLAASRALAFHPPSLPSTAEPLASLL